MIELYKPAPEELFFREELLRDRETMSYNEPWGGAIGFPPEKWEEWYRVWLEAPEERRFYRYLYDTDGKRFVGEAAWRYDEERKICLCSVIVHAKYRNQGFGTAALRLLCEAAKRRRIDALYDDLAAGSPARALFLKEGFEVVCEKESAVLLKKTL